MAHKAKIIFPIPSGVELLGWEISMGGISGKSNLKPHLDDF